MNCEELSQQISLGEDSRRQFKADARNADSLASEIAAFSNSKGGSIFIGVLDNGVIEGLSKEDVARINQLISNAASQGVRSPVAVTTQNIGLPNERIAIALNVPQGIDKPYFDNKGIIWLKAGADKRRINSKEVPSQSDNYAEHTLRRLFQSVSQFHADELPTKASLEHLDKLRFRDFLRDTYNETFPETEDQQKTLLANMNLLADNGSLNLAAVLLFAEQPERITPQFTVKAIRFPGNDVHATEYLDSEDFEGSIQKVYAGSLSFILRNLRKTQKGNSVNLPGTPEIPPIVLEELLVNALSHRDYLISAPIRLFIFDNRIEIISPGHLPNNLTVEKIRAGNSNIRNPILVSYIAKGLLPYRGLGSGIKRALSEWKEIDFQNDLDACLFIATTHRKVSKSTVKSTVKTSQRILDLIKENPSITVAETAERLGLSKSAIEKQLAKLKAAQQIKRIGPDKGGHWEVGS